MRGRGGSPQWEPLSLAGRLEHLHWAIQGGESGATDHPFDIDWAAALRRECRRARVPYFLKQLGARALHDDRFLRLSDGHGGDWDEWQPRLRVRQVPRAHEWRHVRRRLQAAASR